MEHQKPQKYHMNSKLTELHNSKTAIVTSVGKYYITSTIRIVESYPPFKSYFSHLIQLLNKTTDRHIILINFRDK